MDIASIKPTTRVVEIIDPRTKGNFGIKVEIKSLEDDALKTVRRSIQNQTLANESKNKAIKADELDANLVRIMVGSIQKWTWYQPEGSESHPSFQNEEHPECTAKVIKELCDAVPWFKDQISEALSDTDSFFTV